MNKKVTSPKTARKASKIKKDRADYDVMLLLKIGQKEHIEAFQKEGLIYMNTFEYFREYEESSAECRKDVFEGCSELFQPNMGTLEINGKEIKDISGPMKITYDNSEKNNVFCMYAAKYDKNAKYSLEDLNNIIKMNPQNYEFGNYCLILQNADEFLRRLHKSCNEKCLNFKHRLVEYVDTNKHHGEYGFFRKPLEYSYQSEFRIVIENHTGEPYKLFIGDISDISIILETTKYNDAVKLHPKK
ncbi:MAG TPA: hypothetical protein PLD55_13515 [bacterium]|nr:hypothetical protein [bacterium]